MESGQRVVVGVTGSVGNLQAVRCAAAEARRLGCSHVLDGEKAVTV